MSRIYEPASILAPHINGLLAEKHALGYTYRSEELILYRFDQYCIQNHLETEWISKSFLENWMHKTEKEGSFNQGKRISVVRQLMLYMAALGIPVYIPHDFCHFEKKLPHILSAEELHALFSEIDAYQPGGSGSKNKNLMRLAREYRVLFRMIYCCGLRNSEAAGIRVSEVDLEKGVLTVLNSKGMKDRLVYLSPDMTQLAKDYYISLIADLGGEPEWFFPGLDPEKPVPNTTVDNRFAEAWNKTSFAAACNDKPVVHDLRFTFVTNRINHWAEEGRDIQSLMPYLSRYLGHKSISETHYYYHLTLEAARIIRMKDRTASCVIPEVVPYE